MNKPSQKTMAQIGIDESLSPSVENGIRCAVYRTLTEGSELAEHAITAARTQIAGAIRIAMGKLGDERHIVDLAIAKPATAKPTIKAKASIPKHKPLTITTEEEKPTESQHQQQNVEEQ